MSEELRASILRVLPNTVALLVVAILLFKKRVSAEQIDLVRPNSSKTAIAIIACFLLYVFGIEVISSRLGFLEISAWHHSTLSTIIRLIGGVIVSPIIEEVLFRGFVLNVLQKRIGLHAAVIVQASFFVLSHNTTFSFESSALFYAAIGFLDACIYAYVRVYTKSLYPSIIMHAFGNSVAMAERFFLA